MHSDSDDENMIAYQDFKLLAQRKRQSDTSLVAECGHSASKMNKSHKQTSVLKGSQLSFSSKFIKSNKDSKVNGHCNSAFLSSATNCDFRPPLLIERKTLPVELELMEVIDLSHESNTDSSIVEERDTLKQSLNLKNVTKSFEELIESIFFGSAGDPVSPVMNVKSENTSTLEPDRVQLENTEETHVCGDSDSELEEMKPSLKLKNVTKSFELFVKFDIGTEDPPVTPKNVKLENTYSFEETMNDVSTCVISKTDLDQEACNEQLVEVEKYRKSPLLLSQQDEQSSVSRNKDVENCTAEDKTNHFGFKKEAAVVEQPPVFVSSKLTQEVGTQTVLDVSTQTGDFYCTTSEQENFLATIPKQNVSAASSPVICSSPKLDDDVFPNDPISAEKVFVAAHKNANLGTINECRMYGEIANYPQLDRDLDFTLELSEEDPVKHVQVEKLCRTDCKKKIEAPIMNILLNEEGQISIQEVGTVGWLLFALDIFESFKDKRVSYKSKVVCCNFLDDRKLEIKENKRSKSTTRVFKKNERSCGRSIKNTTPLSAAFSAYDNGVAEDDAGILDTKSKCKGSTLKKAMLKISKDKSLQPGRIKKVRAVTKDEIKRRIEDIFEQLFSAFQDNMLPVFAVRARSLANCVIEEGRLQMLPFEDSLVKKIRYGRRGGRKFIMMIHILGRVYNLLSNDLEITKRELYYQIRHLVQSPQYYLNRYIEEVTCLLDAAQWELNIIARNGLVYGDLELVFSSKETLNCNLSGTSIPCNVDEIVEIHANATFILIVEKESIFKQLIEEDLPNKLEIPFILMTGKGFPDLNTQFFLKRLWELLSIPVFIMVDPDPHGLQIMFTYRFGSVAHCHLSHHLAVPGVRWLGIFPSEILKYNMAWTPLQQQEKVLTAHLIKMPCVQDHPQIVNELKTMMSNNRKASIEGLVKDGTFLSSGYLPGKFCSQSYM